MSTLWTILIGAGAFIIAIGGFLIKAYSAGGDKERLKQRDQQIQDEAVVDKGVTDALNADQRVRTESANGGLRNDDGHKRVQ